ncbi:hypothetical protein [Nonomuraea sp. KM90]|uniref:hypothetical protein n=1 Tax=Nonomuraea sp. KM90 TaxID=3457428 RepID=UPI003FCDD877
MIVYGLWFGGSCYRDPENRDLEVFPSLVAARTAFLARYQYGIWQRSRFAFVHRMPVQVLTPCVGADCSMLLYAGLDRLTDPSWRLCVGPRGGIRIERL